MIRKHHSAHSLIVISLLLSILISGTASAATWDPNWLAESNITLNTTIPDNNFQIHLSGDDFEIPVKMWNNLNQDGNDTRILHTDNNTVFPIWIEHITAPDNYSIWVNVTDNTTANNLLWYYGNAAADSVSNEDTTFIFGDDFENATLDTDKWDVLDVDHSITDGILTLDNFTGATTYSNSILGKSFISVSPIVIESEMNNFYSGDNAWIAISNTHAFDDDGIIFGVDYLNRWNMHSRNDGVLTSSAPAGASYNTWYNLKIVFEPGTSAKFYADDVIKATFTTNLPDEPQKAYITGDKDKSPTLKVNYYFIRKYNVVNPVISNIVLDVIINSPPTTPVVIEPSNESIITTAEVVFLNVSSIDVDGDNITFYFYGDTVDGSTLLGTNETINGTSFNWSVQQYDDYYWKARAYDGFNYSAYSNISQFTLIIPPNLTAPVNTSTTYTTYPPLTSLVSFTWQDLSVPQYRFMVAEDENFNVVSVDTHVGTNNSNQDLIVNREYFWKVYSYDGITYSDISDVYSFNLTGNSTLTGSAIEGVVYKANGDVSAILGAEVTIWNSTWSSSMITGSNGYYVFEGLNDETVYNLQAKADRYWDSSIALVSAEADPITNNFYLIDDLTDTEWWHYVEFTLQDIWGVTHPWVATNVYIGTSPTVFESGTTGSDGTITFHLDQNIEYRLTFINSTLGINEETTLYPISKSYTVYIDSYSFALPDTVTDDIQAYIASSRINATHGYINFTWTDTSVLTTSINYYIHDVDGNELYSTNNSGPDMFDSQIVTATDERYIVRYVGIHPVHDTIDQSETVVFHGGRRVDFGWPHDWQYAVTALAFLIFIGSMFGARTAHYGAIAVVIFAWIFKWIGWLNETNTSTLLIILAAVIAFGWSLRKSEEVKM